MRWPLAVGANIYKNYDLETACKSLSNIGVGYIDIDFIQTPDAFEGNKKLEHITEKELDNYKEIRNMLERYNLRALTFSGHMTLLYKEELELFVKK